jgi:hypothetical protein
MTFLRSAQRTNWTILKVEDSICNLEFVNKLKEVSKTITLKGKDNSKVYEGIGVQYKDTDITEDEKNYNTLDQYSNYVYFEEEIGDFISYSKTEKCYIVISDLRRIKLSEVSKRLQDKAKDLETKVNDSNSQVLNHVFLNEWAKVFKDFILYFLNKNIFLYRGRLLNCKKGKIGAAIHVDNNVRLHIPIYTNKKCTTTFYDKQQKLIGQYHMPADGSFYLFNSWLPHSFGNMGEEDRLHAVFSFDDQLPKSFNNIYKSTNDLKKIMLNDLNKF